MVELLVGQSERHVTLTNRTSLTNLICIRFHSSKIRKISCPVESLDEDVRYEIYKWYVWCIYTGFCMDKDRNKETNVDLVKLWCFAGFTKNHETFQSYEDMLPLRCRLLYDWRDLNLKDVKDPIGIGHIHQIERISQRKPIITKGMRHWPWVCDVDMQISNDCLYFTFNVKHPTSIVQDVPRTEHTTAYMYMSISNEANNNQLINLNVSVLFCRSLRYINIIQNA